MSDGNEWELEGLKAQVRKLTGEVRALQAWRATVQGAGQAAPVLEPVTSRVERAEAACRAAGVSEEEMAQTAAPLRHEPESLAEALESLAEEDTLGGRLKRSGLERWAEQ